MFRLIESIRIENGEPQLLEFHQKRLNKAFKHLFNGVGEINIAELLANQKLPQSGTYKFRLLYNRDKHDFEMIPYSTPKINSLILIKDDDLYYPYKYEKRSALDRHKVKCEEEQDFIIVRKGLLTDGYFYNIVLIDKSKKAKVTPKDPLLKGVMRENLLKKREISLANITVKDLKKFSEIHLINALNPLGKIVVPVESIKIS